MKGNRPTKAQVEARIAEILQIRLDGAQHWDLCEYVREKEAEEGSPWKLADGAKPLSDSQIRRYAAKADKLIAESCRASRKKLLRRHLAQRRHLFAKTVAAADYRTASAILKDEAQLLGLYKDEDEKGSLEVLLQALPAELGRALRFALGEALSGGSAPGSSVPGVGADTPGPEPDPDPRGQDPGRVATPLAIEFSSEDAP